MVLSIGIHWVELLFLLGQGQHMYVRSRTALCQAQDTLLLRQSLGGTARPFLWRVTQPCVLGGADSTSIFCQSLRVGKEAATWQMLSSQTTPMSSWHRKQGFEIWPAAVI